MSITDELLAELEAAAGNACCYARDDWFSADDFDHPFEQGDAEFIAIANPSTIKALLAHIVELKRDAKRLEWLTRDRAAMHELIGSDGPRYCLHWHDDGEQQEYVYKTPRDAIDAAMESAQ
jgi:hypothetical protein